MPVKAAFIVPHPPVIVPQVGKGREADIKATADSYHRVAKRIGELSPDTVIVFSPHSTMYADYIHISPGRQAKGSLARFGAPGTVFAKYDSDLVRALCGLCEKEDFPAGTLGENTPELDHGTLVPLHFINQCASSYKLVRIAPSGLSREEHYRFGMLVGEAADMLRRNVVIVASGDLSHKLTADGPYGFAPEGPKLDRVLTDIMKSGNFHDFFAIPDSLSEKGADCGLLPFVMMAGTLDGVSVTPELHSYEGPFGVGYAVASFYTGDRDDSRRFWARRRAELSEGVFQRRGNEDIRVRLARETLEARVRAGKTPPLPPGLLPELTDRRAGVFVSIKKHGRLRGCIGTIQPVTSSVAEEIRRNAVSAGLEDPRFQPVCPEELEELTYSVDILSPAEDASWEDLDPVRYGVIVTSGARRGLLLPNLEGVDSVERQIEIAKQKAGIGPGEKYSLQRFEVVRYT